MPTSEQYMSVVAKIIDKRADAMKEFDDQLDKVVKAMVENTETSADNEVDQYILLRDISSALASYEKKRKAAIEPHMDTLNARLLKRLNDQGVKSMAAQSATFYRDTKYRPSCSDWKVFYQWIKQTDNFEALEKRVTKKFVVDHLEREKELPPGISMNSTYEVVVRRNNDRD